MKPFDVKEPQKVAWPAAAGVSFLLIVGMVYLRVAVYPDRVVPLTYALPLLIGLWHRDRILLWVMAICFMVLSTVKVLWLVPDRYFDDGFQQFIFAAMQWLNIAVPAGVIHLVLNYRRSLERSNEVLAATNAELETSNEELAASNKELAAREEEISRQNEELQAQTEELEQQAEELRIQAEELQDLNEELSGRESTLEMLLQLSSPATNEPEVLHEICAVAPKLLGEHVLVAAILERRDGEMVVRSHSVYGPNGPEMKLPAESTLAAMAIERGQVAQLEDTRLRPDLLFPLPRSGESPRSVLSVPLCVGDGPAGALEAYASQPRSWSDQQVRLLQWLAGQCARVWESVRLRDDLAREQAQLRALADAIPQLAWMAEPDGYIFWYNHRWYEYTGTTPEQMEGWGWQSVHDPRVLPDVVRNWKGSIATGEPFDMTFPLRGADGVFRPFLTRVMPLKDEQGRVRRWFGTNTDVSEQKRAEEALRGSEQRYRSFVEASAQAVWTTNPRGEVEMDIPAWQALTGQTTDEAHGFGWMDAIRAEDRPRVAEAWRKAFDSGGLYEVEYLLKRHDGQWRDILARGVPVLAPDGSVREYVGTCIDITERKQAEESLRETAKELARSNKDLEQFAYVASHDLQEPLRMVAGYLQLLSERYQGKLDEKADKYIAYAVDGAERMSVLINDLLAYSRVNSRGEQFRETCADEALDFALKNLASAIEESGASIARDPLPLVRADKAQLRQLFQNLVGNAVKFRAPDRPAAIHISARQEAGHWLFAVQDNGIGFDEKYQDKMFMIFQRLHSRAKYPGTGIGLAICKRIVERHGGRIWANGRPGQGATFYFTLPIEGKP